MVDDLNTAAEIGYAAKSFVHEPHAALINQRLAFSPEELARAKRIVDAFEAAQLEGKAQVTIDGRILEVPAYKAALQVLKTEVVHAIDMPLTREP